SPESRPSADHDRAGGEDFAYRQIRRIVAGFDRVAHSRRGLAVDLDRLAADHDGPLVGRRFLERRTRRRWDMCWRVVGCAVLRRRGLAHDLHVVAEPTRQLTGEGMWQGRWHRWSWRRRHHHNVSIDREHLIALLGCWLSHPRTPQFRLMALP